MSNIFNEYFVNVPDNIEKTIPRTPNSPLSYLGSAVENSLFLSPVTHLEIEDLIANLNSSKSIGPNSVPTNILKILKHNISHPLTEIVNQSFLKGTFPSKLKIAKVGPALKRETQRLDPIIDQFLYCQFLVKCLKNWCIKGFTHLLLAIK